MVVGIGCDIVEINRFQRNTEALALRILSKKEQELFYTYSNHRQLEYLAGHFAAKEAIVKAMDQNCLLSDFEILYKDHKPIVKKDGYEIHVSISHEKEYAIAYAIVQRS